MFGFLTGGKAQINLTLDHSDGVYHPGEAILARVNVIGEKDLKVQQGRIAFIYAEEFQVREQHTRTDSDGHHHQSTQTVWRKDERQLNQNVFLPEATIASGTNQNFDFTFQIPPHVPPSINGSIVRIKWLIKATLDRKMAGDIEALTELSVPSIAPSEHAGEGTYGSSNEPADADLQLRLPGKEFALGETIAGTLLVSPQKDFDANEVRLALVQRENVPHALGNTHTQEQTVKLASQAKLRAGQPLAFPFNAVVPPNGLPSAKTPNSSVTWLLVGTLARRLRQDTFVEESVSVYSQRAR